MKYKIEDMNDKGNYRFITAMVAGGTQGENGEVELEPEVHPEQEDISVDLEM